MAEEIERLLVRVEANAVQFENQMRKINKVLYGSQAETRKTLSRIERDTSSASRTMFKPIGEGFKREMAGLATALAATFSAQQIVQYADAWTAAGNKLAAAGVASGDLAERQEELVRVANDSRTGAQETIALYSRLTIATQEMGVSSLSEIMDQHFPRIAPAEARTGDVLCGPSGDGMGDAMAIRLHRNNALGFLDGVCGEVVIHDYVAAWRVV